MSSTASSDCVGGCAQGRLSHVTDADRWQQVVDRAQAVGRLPTVVAGVLQGGHLVWTGSAGAPTATDMQYRIGSITKTMNAVAVLQCRDDGLLSLDDPLGRVVPESGYRDATLRSLLAHVSGMQSEPTGSWWERSPGVDVASLISANDGSGAIAPAGSFFHYSNLGHALLGEVVARLRGESWWEVVSGRLLGPLGMTRTSYLPDGEAAQGFSVEHYSGSLMREPHQDTGAMAPAGQLWSTIDDLAKWGRFLALGEASVVSSESLQEMAQPVAASPEYGLGLRLLTCGDKVLVGHTGSMPGFLATLFVDQGSGDGALALTNATTGFDPVGMVTQLLAGAPVEPEPAWVPTASVPDWAAELLGVWFWGNSAQEIRLHNGMLQLHDVAMHEVDGRFAEQHGQIVGVDGYHRGETLNVVRRPDRTISHLDCATFIYTRIPYDPTTPIPGH
ncbi:MAG: hypothetical protein JWR35_507 [Marmoricola sp.]|nr:hypothetical protein [Marmoricola sp.]